MQQNTFFYFLKQRFFLWNISKKTWYFNTGFVFYSVNIQPDIMQNWYKNIWENHNFFERIFEIFFIYFLLYVLIN